MDEFWVEKFGMNVGESEFEDDRSIVYMEVRSHPLSLTRGDAQYQTDSNPRTVPFINGDAEQRR